MLLNCDRNRMNGPRFLPSGSRFGPYFCRRFAASAASKPLPASVVRRFATSSTAIPCQAMASAVGLAFAAVLIGVLREALVLVVPRIRAPSDHVQSVANCRRASRTTRRRALQSSPHRDQEFAMSIPCKFERSILSYDEHEIILRSHHPEIYDAGLDDLKTLRQRLRDMRNRERTLARENRRAVRGKGAPRGGSFPGTAEHPLQRKQVFAAALKRVNKEIGRMQKLDARIAHIEAARRALAMRRAAQFPARPPA